MPLAPAKLLVFDTQPAALLARLAAHGYSVRSARDEAELETLATRERADLVLGDLEAAGSSPVRVARRLKASLLLRHLPLVVLSRRGELDRRIAAVNAGADDYLVEPLDDAELVARLDRAVARTRASLDANPLTGLPGNTSIKAEMAARLAAGTPFAALFIDLDSFKAFNDCYGFERGDRALRLLADIVLETLRAPGRRQDFAGHVGGDDFVVLTAPARAEAFAARICRLVDQQMPALYDRADRQGGGITSVDRQGRVCRFPLMTVSVAILTSDGAAFTHPGHLAQVGSELKHYLKQQGRGGEAGARSRYLLDRRRALPIAHCQLPMAGRTSRPALSATPKLPAASAPLPLPALPAPEERHARLR
jgi:diguanylate cyclase (GGDEF)-like protein